MDDPHKLCAREIELEFNTCLSGSLREAACTFSSALNGPNTATLALLQGRRMVRLQRSNKDLCRA